MVGINLNRLAEFCVSFRKVLQVQLSSRQLVMGFGVTRIDLQGFLELNYGRIVLLLLHVLHATLYVLTLGGFRVTSATNQDDCQYSHHNKDDVAVTHAFSWVTEE